jgi:hypothetical protein
MVHYLNVVTPDPLIIVRTPYPLPRWRLVVKALTPVMQSHGYKQKDISSIEGLLPYPDDSWSAEDVQFASRVEKAFAGDPAILPRFWLYDWKAGKFVVARKAS